ncbi:MAG: hypothetical protein LBM08_07130 [Dysgonamonadaceae bacterium]|nr:hypothetical protein [Dysgonamonadaceae bacterium]
MTIKNIAGENAEVTNLDAAIEQCEICKNSPFKTSSGHTVGEHTFMLEQLKQLKRSQRRDNLLASTKRKMEQGKRLTKEDMAYEIGRIEAYHPASLYWDTLKRDEILRFFNNLFGTTIE